MSTSLDDVPEGLVQVDLREGSAVVELDSTLYPVPAVYGAVYTFLDRCYMLLDRPADGRLRVTLMTHKPEPAVEDLRALVGELANELLACAYRQQLTQDNRVMVETVTMQAMAGALGAPSLTDLADFDFTDEALDDPLGIAQSWEEKHGKTVLESAPSADAGASPDAAGTSPDAAGTSPDTAGTSPDAAGASPDDAGASPHRAPDGASTARSEDPEAAP